VRNLSAGHLVLSSLGDLKVRPDVWNYRVMRLARVLVNRASKMMSEENVIARRHDVSIAPQYSSDHSSGAPMVGALFFFPQFSI